MFFSTFILSVGGTKSADTGAISGSHNNVVLLATDQVIQCAVGAWVVAGEDLSVDGGFHSIHYCIGHGCPGHLSDASATVQLAGHIFGRTWLWRGKQNSGHC